jgi:hypothetical protein
MNCADFPFRKVVASVAPTSTFEKPLKTLQPTSRRTLTAASHMAFSFPKAVLRGMYFMPQSGAGIRRSADTYLRPLRMRSATVSTLSIAGLPRSSTPSMIFFD